MSYKSNETAGNSQAEYAAIGYGDEATLSNKVHENGAASDHNDPEYAAVQDYEQPCILMAPNQSYRALYSNDKTGNQSDTITPSATGHHEPPTLRSAGYENVSPRTYT